MVNYKFKLKSMCKVAGTDGKYRIIARFQDAKTLKKMYQLQLIGNHMHKGSIHYIMTNRPVPEDKIKPMLETNAYLI